MKNLTKPCLKSEKSLREYQALAFRLHVPVLNDALNIQVESHSFLGFSSKPSLQGIVPVCEACKDRVLDCYHSNPTRALNCSREVKQYTECVEKARKASSFR